MASSSKNIKLGFYQHIYSDNNMSDKKQLKNIKPVPKFENLDSLISNLPQLPQVQYDLATQLTQLMTIADKFGLYDAADYLYKKLT